MRPIILALLLTGCTYNGFNDPNIVWPIEWGVDNHLDRVCLVHA